MFKRFNIFFSREKNKNQNIQENSLNNTNTNNNSNSNIITINTLEKKKFNLDNVIGNFYVESVYDGDTITLIIPTKLHIYNMISSNQIDELTDNNKSNIIYFNSVRIRLFGIDTPEIKPSKNLQGRDEHIRKAKEARDFLSNQILGKVIKVEFLSNDKYGRPLAKIYNGNICLNDLIVEKGYAKKYDGGTKDTEF